MKQVLLLVEGQTEERFVKDILAPYMWPRDISLIPTLLRTKIVKDGPNFKGGVSTFGKIRADIVHLLNGSGGGLVTTMLDYYRLPGDTPGMADRPPGSPYLRVKHVEESIAVNLGSAQNLLVYLLLHEFESLLFTAPEEISRSLAVAPAASLRSARDSVSSPEEINDRPDTAPSSRILAAYPGYRKVLHGPMTAGRIGLDAMRNDCPHFNEWLNSVEAHA